MKLFLYICKLINKNNPIGEGSHMETKLNYTIYFSNYCLNVTGYIFWKFKDWAMQNKIEFQIVKTENFCKNSYNEETKDEYGGDAKPTDTTFSIRFGSDFPKLFFSSMAYFRWEKE